MSKYVGRQPGRRDKIIACVIIQMIKASFALAYFVSVSVVYENPAVMWDMDAFRRGQRGAFMFALCVTTIGLMMLVGRFVLWLAWARYGYLADVRKTEDREPSCRYDAAMKRRADFYSDLASGDRVL